MHRSLSFFAVAFIVMISMPQLVWAQDDGVDDALGLSDTAETEGEAEGEGATGSSASSMNFGRADLDGTGAAVGSDDAEQKPADADVEAYAEPERVQDSGKKTNAPSASSLQAFNNALVVQPGHENAPGEHAALLPLVAVDPAVAPKRLALLEHLLYLSLLGRKDFDVVDLRPALEPSSGQDVKRLIENATAMYVAGRQSYENLDAEKAIDQLESSCRTFEAGYAGLRDPHTMALAHIYLASLYMLNGQAETGAPYYRSALFLEPELELDINVFAPEDIDALEAQRSFINSSIKGRIEVDSVPVSTRVYVDNVFRGSSPLQIEGLAPGRHFLRLERNGYERVADVVEVKSDQLSHITRRLIPLRGNDKLQHLLVLVEPDRLDLGGVLKPLGLLFSSNYAVILTGNLAASGQIHARLHYADLKTGLRLRHVDGVLPQDQAAASAALRSLVDQVLDLSAGAESQPANAFVGLSRHEDGPFPWTPVFASLGGLVTFGALGAGAYFILANQEPEGHVLQGGERVVVLGF